MDEVILNKTASIERLINKIQERYISYEEQFHSDLMRQESIILCIQRLCHTALDLGIYIIKIKKIGIPQSRNHIFKTLRLSKILPSNLCEKLQSLIIFRNITDQQLPILPEIIKNNLADFEQLVQEARNLD